MAVSHSTTTGGGGQFWLLEDSGYSGSLHRVVMFILKLHQPFIRPGPGLLVHAFSVDSVHFY
jgi:hypothetical protein